MKGAISLDLYLEFILRFSRTKKNKISHRVLSCYILYKLYLVVVLLYSCGIVDNRFFLLSNPLFFYLFTLWTSRIFSVDRTVDELCISGQP